MRSRKKKRNNASILLVIGKGIAASMSLELAMLFCQAGFRVRPAFLESADAWIAKNPIKLVTGEDILTSTNHPKWSLSEKNFLLSILVNPEKLLLNDFFSGLSQDFVMQYALENSSDFLILSESAPKKAFENVEQKVFFHKIPARINDLRNFWENIFSQAIEFLNSIIKLEKFPVDISFSPPEELDSLISESPAWINELKVYLKQCGFQIRFNQAVKSPKIIIKAYDGPIFPVSEKNEKILTFPSHYPANDEAQLQINFIHKDFPEENLPGDVSGCYYAKRINSGIKLFTSSGIRLFPELSSQSSLFRLARFLRDQAFNLLQSEKEKSAILS